MNCTGTEPNLCTLIEKIIVYLDQALFLLMAVAIVMFVWYVIKYFIKPDAEKKEAGNYLLYSIIGFFVILSLWGLVNILGNTFGLGNATNQAPSWQNFNSIFPRSGSPSNRTTQPTISPTLYNGD